jgi:hypothetical protein
MANSNRQRVKRGSHGGIHRVHRRIDLSALLDTPPWDWPPEAATKFLEILRNPEAPGSDRLIAARLAGDYTVINDPLSDALLGIVSGADQPDKLRATAAIALGPILDHAGTFGFEDDPEDVPITEDTFNRIRSTLREVYSEQSVPKEVRRRILEASVRSPEDWHREAISHAHSSGDREWMLTAVFAMRYVRGFDRQILEALKSEDREIQREAVHAAGNWELDAAWRDIVALAENESTPKPLLLAAIGAVGSIRPREAEEALFELTDSDDEEIAEAAEEAVAMARSPSEDDSDAFFDDDEEEEDEGDGSAGWIH